MRSPQPNIEKYRKKFSPEKLSVILSLLSSSTIGNWAYSEGHFTVIENITDVSFITGDQPIYNLSAEGLGEDEEVTNMDLYYPLTPKLALLITSKVTSVVVVDEARVKKYNDFIFKVSNDQIYAKDEESLRDYV